MADNNKPGHRTVLGPLKSSVLGGRGQGGSVVFIPYFDLRTSSSNAAGYVLAEQRQWPRPLTSCLFFDAGPDRSRGQALGATVVTVSVPLDYR